MLKFLSLTHELMLILTPSERSIKTTVIMITTITISFSKARLPAVLNKQSLATRSEGLSFHLVLTEFVSQHPLIYASSGEKAFPTAVSDPVSLCKATHHRASYFHLWNGANHLQALTPAIVSDPHLSGNWLGSKYNWTAGGREVLGLLVRGWEMETILSDRLPGEHHLPAGPGR